jgi:hypothetical protein
MRQKRNGTSRKTPRRVTRPAGIILAAGGLLAMFGCPPPPPMDQYFDPIPLRDIVSRVNANSERLTVTVKAIGGHATGQYRDADGVVRAFDLDASLLVMNPRFLRLDLKAMFESQLVFGSNAQKYWVVQPAQRTLTWGAHDRRAIPSAEELVVRPDLFVEALGMNPLPRETRGTNGPMQRVTAKHQQLLFVEYDQSGQAFVSKEYWISRSRPHVVERMVFRDPDGAVALDSRISDYRQIGVNGPYLPHKIDVVAPATKSRLYFTALGWQIAEQVGAEHPAFVFPPDRGDTFDRVINLDERTDRLRYPQYQSGPGFGANPPAGDPYGASPYGASPYGQTGQPGGWGTYGQPQSRPHSGAEPQYQYEPGRPWPPSGRQTPGPGARQPVGDPPPTGRETPPDARDSETEVWPPQPGPEERWIEQPASPPPGTQTPAPEPTPSPQPEETDPDLQRRYRELFGNE